MSRNWIPGLGKSGIVRMYESKSKLVDSVIIVLASGFQNAEDDKQV